jgi:hypothetical protein
MSTCSCPFLYVKVEIFFSDTFFFEIIPSYAQVYLAGDTLPGYVDIDPDSLLSYVCPHSSERFSFDINEDNQDDFEINASCGVSPGTTSIQIYIKSLNPDSYTRFGYTDSAYHTYLNYWMTVPVALPLNYGDTINSSGATWSRDLFMTYFYLSAGSGISGSPWQNTVDEFIGIKFEDATDTIYGWVRVNMQLSNACLVKDYAYSSSHISASEISLKKTKIYPNPANDFIRVETGLNKPFNLQLSDLQGRIVFQQDIIGHISIDTGRFSDGVYLVFLRSPDAVLVRRIIIDKK